MTYEYLNDLNTNQRRAVKHGATSGSANAARALLVIAGAGSGKTQTLAHRVAHLIVNGVHPHRILLLTFSRRAAEDMTSRVKQITAEALGTQHIGLPWAGTFHSIGARLLREYASQIGLNPSFTIHDQSDSEDLIDLVRHELGLSEQKSRFPQKKTCLAIYSFVINSAGVISRASVQRVLRTKFPWCEEWASELRKLFRRYADAKRRQNVLDFDDLLLYWAKMLDDVDLATKIRGRFDHALVDEYQDTNPLQAEILLKLKPDGRGLMVVGDDDQSIYSFRAATVRNILDFPNQFDPPARIIKLEQNYRSTQPILDASNKVIGFTTERFPKNLWSNRPSKQKPLLTNVTDEAGQARYVAQQILDAREAGVPLKSQAVLFRTSQHSAQLELELDRRNIPFVKYGGVKFLESAHVKVVLSLLRWCENPLDRVSGFRVLQLLPGIGPTTAAKILNHAEGRARKVNVLAKIEVPKAAQEDWPAFTKIITEMLGDDGCWPAEFHLVRAWYEPHLQRLHDSPDSRAADLVQLEQIATRYSTREQFLTDLTLDPPDGPRGLGSTSENDEEYTVLSTIHSAKGRQWRAVRILNVVEGCIPSDKATTATEIEEERRLLYVAMTRAMDDLDLIVSQRLYIPQQPKLSDRHRYAATSRFIPSSIHRLFDCRDQGEHTDVSNKRTNRSRKSDIPKTLLRRWRV
jgi:DNA helicase-2/ATP-dependent DNA helicase PcrA